MTASNLIGDLQELINIKREEAFKEPEKATNCETLGILVAEYCEWNKTEIKEVIYSILEDANFHTMNADLELLWEEKEKLEKDDQDYKAEMARKREQEEDTSIHET